MMNPQPIRNDSVKFFLNVSRTAINSIEDKATFNMLNNVKRRIEIENPPRIRKESTWIQTTISYFKLITKLNIEKQSWHKKKLEQKAAISWSNTLCAMWRESANPHRIRKESSTNSDNRIILKKEDERKANKLETRSEGNVEPAP